MAINFPTPTSVGQQYRYGIRTWEWNGTAWQLLINPAFGYGSTTVNGDLSVAGTLTVSGTTTTINSTTLTVDDKNIELGSVDTPSNTTANGGGITLKAGTDVDKTILWDSANSNWTTSENLNLATGKTLKINNVNVISGTGAALVVGGNASTSLTLGASGGTVSIASGATFSPTLTSPTINTSIVTGTTFTLGALATTLSLGATTGTTAVKNPTIEIGQTSATVSFPTATTITYTSGGATPSVAFHNLTATTFTTAGAATSYTIGGTTTATLTASFFANATASGNTKTLNLGTAGVSGSITNINIGSAVSGATGTTTLNQNVIQTKLLAMGTTSGAPTVTIASNTITPTTPIVFLGAGSINTITPPAPISTNGGQITIIPTAAFTTTTTGGGANIGLASTAVISKALIMTYDPTTTKWYPSY
jgi:hypothetical protein